MACALLHRLRAHCDLDACAWQDDRAASALRAVEWLAEHTAADEAQLRAVAAPLLADDYIEAVQERALGRLCGCAATSEGGTCSLPALPLWLRRRRRQQLRLLAKRR